VAVSKRLRYEILRRDNHACRYCGATAPDAKLVVDHVTPTALGGTDTPDNLVTACEPCNSGKSSVPTDAPVVAAVRQRQRDWQTAITATADQDREQQEFANAFLEAWDDAGELPPGWKKTIDAYRKSGLAPHMWDEIVNIALAKPGIEDRFRYCCGVARNRVAQLQRKAAKLVDRPVGDTDPEDDYARRNSAVLEAAYAAWYAAMGGDEEGVSPEVVATFRQSLDRLQECEFIGLGRIVAAAEDAGYFGVTDIKQALRNLDQHDAWMAWINSWPTTYVPDDDPKSWGGTLVGGPSSEAKDWVKEQIDKLLDAKVHVSRIARAATYAGFHKSVRIYRGLTEEELEASGQHHMLARIAELWRVAFTAGGDREPTDAETRQLFSSVQGVASTFADDPDLLWCSDLFEAAASAGAYQDPDLVTCLPLQRSVFVAAARLPVTRPVTRDIERDTPVTSQTAPSR
jgi:hypothetical protein